ncbi:MAG: hypothetical protein NT130_05875 [Candidatus Micrarchaeota archaeon]|nr:hypothetical protein [Candidatus Micrarchaeota archaeon]
MPAVEIAIIILFALLPFLFAYISFNLWNRYTALGIFFLLFSLGSVIASLGIIINLADAGQYSELSYLFGNMMYAIVIIMLLTIATLLFEVASKKLKFPNIKQALRNMYARGRQ